MQEKQAYRLSLYCTAGEYENLLLRRSQRVHYRARESASLLRGPGIATDLPIVYLLIIGYLDFIFINNTTILYRQPRE